MPTEYSINLATSAPCLLFTLTRVDGNVEYFTNASHDITISSTTWTAHPGLRVGARTSRIDGTPPTMSFTAQLQSSAPLKFRDVIRGKYESSYVRIELTSQDNPATRDFVFSGRILGETRYNQHGMGFFDLISEFAIPRGILIEKFTLMCRWNFGQWNTCRIPVFPHSIFPYSVASVAGSDPPPRSTWMASGYWMRYRFDSNGTPEDFHNVIMVCVCTPNPSMTGASMPAWDDTVGAVVADGPNVTWTTMNAYARAAKIVSVDKHVVTLDRLPDPRWTTTLIPEQVKLVFRSGEYAGRAFRGANWSSANLTFETYLPCPLAAFDDWIEIAPECNKTITMCKDYFNNTHNYGGFPYQQGAKAQAQQLGYPDVGP